jgi:hypothetical protein
MAEQCFKKQGSDPPICGVHNVMLMETQGPEKLTALGLTVTFYICPASGQTIRDAASWGEPLGWDNLQLTHLPFAAAYGLSASGFAGASSFLNSENISTGSGKTMVVSFPRQSQ